MRSDIEETRAAEAAVKAASAELHRLHAKWLAGERLDTDEIIAAKQRFEDAHRAWMLPGDDLVRSIFTSRK